MRARPPTRTRRASRIGAALVLAVACPPLQAQTLQLEGVEVLGVAGEFEQNILSRLSLAQHPADEPLTEARLSYLLRQAPGEVLTALEPFGFYSPEVSIEPQRSGESVRVQVVVTPGRPVQVRSHDIELAGEGGEDPVLTAHRDAFRPAPGAILDHRLYEASKGEIQRALIARGYFDAEPGVHQVTVTRAEYAADIALAWDTGVRHAFGPTTFVGSQIDPELLARRIPYEAGQPFDQDQLVAMHRQLAELEYFGLIDIQPRPEQASGDAVPIEVSVTPAKRSLYTAGVSYGTDHGAAIELGLQRRYVNARGHKLDADVQIGQRRHLGSLVYRIPTRAGPPGWWSAGLTLREQDVADFGPVQATELVVGRNGEWRGHTFAADLHAHREWWDEEVATLVYPQLQASRSQGDHPLYPRRGWGWSVLLRGGHTALGSDIDFVQALGELRWIRPLGESNRLLLRGQLGSSWTDRFGRMPPTLRFYAGGDRSVRGYGYQELGPQDAEGRVVGGKHLAVASAEVEHMFNDTWGIAGFVDAGDAFSGGDFEPRAGVGMGVRWRSPVGPVRVDVGVGLDDPDRVVRLHLTIGPEL